MFKPVTDSHQISRLVLSGYKSIAACDVALGRLNVLIGANGAGKSNLIGFFRLINRILDQQLQMAVGLAGGPDALLHCCTLAVKKRKNYALSCTLATTAIASH